MHPKQGAQGLIGYLHLDVILGVESGAKLEVRPYLSPQGKPKMI